MTGNLIVISGTDGSGKGTQTRLLLQRLKDEGYPVEMTDFPQYKKESSCMVRDYLNGRFGSANDVGPYRASIFYAIDRYDASIEMKKWLSDGKLIVSNRYVSANLGHQGGKIDDPVQRKKYVEWIRDLEYNILGIPKPAVNIFLHVPSEISQQLVDKKNASEREYAHGKKRDIHEADLNHLKNSEAAYLDVCSKDESWVKIECVKKGQLLSIEEVSELIWTVVKERVLSKFS
jgi:dTMP kinase